MLVRILLTLPRGKDGLFIQPRDVSPERETVEQHNRDRAAAKADYSDPFTGNTRTFDVDGNYVCGTCNQDTKGDCELVQVDRVDEKAGSCGKYEVRCAGDAEIEDLKRLTFAQAGYAIAENGEGFGCHRCHKQEKAYQPDSQGRELYCGEWDCRVFWNACCNNNDAEEVPIDEHGIPKGEEMKLTSGERKHIPASEFGMPGSRKYPMPDRSHAANAKARATQMVAKGKLSSGMAAKIRAKADRILGK